MPVRQRREATSQGQRASRICETTLLTLLCETTHDLTAGPDLGQRRSSRMVATASAQQLAMPVIGFMNVGTPAGTADVVAASGSPSRTVGAQTPPSGVAEVSAAHRALLGHTV